MRASEFVGNRDVKPPFWSYVIGQKAVCGGGSMDKDWSSAKGSLYCAASSSRIGSIGDSVFTIADEMRLSCLILLLLWLSVVLPSVVDVSDDLFFLSLSWQSSSI